MSQNSKNSEKPAKSSKEQWQTPKDVKALASQANKVTTMLLTGQIDLETARTYSAMVRGIAQLVGAEVSRARARREEPDLSLED